jgi:hypothetical protein
MKQNAIPNLLLSSGGTQASSFLLTRTSQWVRLSERRNLDFFYFFATSPSVAPDNVLCPCIHSFFSVSDNG